MANELEAFQITGLTIYVHIVNPDNHGQRWNGDEFENYASGNYADYDIPLVEQGSSGAYFADFPTDIELAGDYEYIQYSQAGGSPAEGDEVIGTGVVRGWDGEEATGATVTSDIALITTAQGKAFLGISGSSEDMIISTLIDSMSKMIASYCGRDLIEDDYTEYYDGHGYESLILKNYPIIEVTSVNSDGSRLFGASTEIDVDDNVIVDEESGMLTLWNLFSHFPIGRRNIKVVYSAGYPQNAIPKDLQHACKLALLYAYKRHYTDQKIGIATESIGDKTTTFDITDLPKPIKLILEPYRKKGTSVVY